MSEINLTDQRPKTSKAEMPEWAKAKQPLPKDAELDEIKARLLEKLARRMAERRQG